LDLHFIPEPFIGRKDAPVVLLGNNPGFRNKQASAHRKEPAFADRMRSNLMHHLSEESPFLYLDPEPHISPPGYSWWENKLKHLFREFGKGDIARRILSQAVLAVEFFPYVSQKYGHDRLSVPSQQYSFELVQSAMARRAAIVLTRGERRWYRAVKGLASYSGLIVLKEVQRARISPGNCRNPEKYQEIIHAIKATLTW